MKLRRSRTLIFYPEQDAIIGCNFLTKNVFHCNQSVVELLNSWNDWATIGNVSRNIGFDLDELSALAEELRDHTALVEYDSELEAREQEFSQQWRWSLPTALMHFCVQDAEYISAEESERQQLVHLNDEPSPALHRHNTAGALPLPSPSDTEVIRVMARRRTVRTAAEKTIDLQQLSDCLFAGLGITGETSNCTGKLPLAMTPSGGARNPYEAFVVARAVQGLDPGIYHYSALDHDLGRLTANHLPRFSELVGGQDWADDMPCLILLCADLGRTMWKYSDANAYRVVMIEAGHIGQNIMLAATCHGLSACPTAALNHSTINQLLGAERLIDAPVYALTLANPGNMHEAHPSYLN